MRIYIKVKNDNNLYLGVRFTYNNLFYFIRFYYILIKFVARRNILTTADIINSTDLYISNIFSILYTQYCDNP